MLVTWFPVALRVTTEGFVIRVVGDLDVPGTVWITSQVVTFDEESCMIETKSGSCYGLGRRGTTPELRHVLHVAAALWQSAPSLAARFGVPKVWY